MGKSCASLHSARSKEILVFLGSGGWRSDRRGEFRRRAEGNSPGIDGKYDRVMGVMDTAENPAPIERAVRFDTRPSVEHPTGVTQLVHRLSALALSLALMAANAAVCAGWAPTPEARMACCAEGDTCPMHKGDSHGSGAEHGLTQAQADGCCASAEREHSSQASPTIVAALTSAVLGTGIVLPARVPGLVLSDGWRTAVPVPTVPVRKHVLLSVFLV